MSTLDAAGLARGGDLPRASSYLPVASGALLVFVAYFLGAKVGLAQGFYEFDASNRPEGWMRGMSCALRYAPKDWIVQYKGQFSGS